MLLELLGLAALSLLGRNKSSARVATEPIIVKDTKKTEYNKPEEPEGVEKKFENCQIELKKSSILIKDESSISDELFYTRIFDLPIIKNSNDHSIMIIKHNKDTYFLKLKNNKITADNFKLIQKEVINCISSIIYEFHSITIKEYLRDTTIKNLGTNLEIIVSNFKKSIDSWRTKFNQDVINQLLACDEFLPLENGKKILRKQFESNALIERDEFFNNIESNPLTKQQRLAVVRNNDLNLVLAAAGTGKTSVIVAKVLDLIDSRRAKSNEILVLAYNNSASKELKNRMLSRGSSINISEINCPKISTFHALGKTILRESKLPSNLSDFGSDESKLQMWVTKWLIDYIKSSPSSLKNFIELSYHPVNPFDFTTKEEYDRYIRDNEYRTLQGERVAGYQELLIANWFFLNGIDYEYEEPYISKRRIDVGYDYRPDFHFKNTSIYLEHFGIDRNKNTRKDIDKKDYNSSIENKRRLHQECQTTLLETYHYDWLENNLESRLSELVLGVDLKIQPKSSTEIFATLKKMGVIDKSAKSYIKAMRAIRVESLDSENILKRLNDNNIVNADKYTKLLTELHNSYKSELKNQNRIDFDEMIIKSTEAIIKGLFKPNWSHILVDEFQDISMARMDLLKTLITYGPTPLLTVVGDDWQSIYRFSGGKLELTTRIGKILGTHSVTKLEESFRNTSSIANNAGTFIMQNPEQYKKNVKTIVKDKKSHVYLFDNKIEEKSDLEGSVTKVIQAIRKKDSSGSIAILARYRYLLNNIQNTIKVSQLNSNIKYWTFHGSKGLEADYSILVGFFQGKTGFPNLNKEDIVTEALLPTLDKFPHTEERRLLYVAITRARKESYLIADPMTPSVFIDELLTSQYDLNIVSEGFKERFRKVYKCSLCSDGYYKLRSGKYGEYYSCTSGSICKSKPRKCNKCGAPSIDTANKSTCNNESCGNEINICDKCGRPMRIREGKFGKFLGCSGYDLLNDQCKNTKKLERLKSSVSAESDKMIEFGFGFGRIGNPPKK